MKITEMANDRVFIEATNNKVLTNDSGEHFDTVIIKRDRLDSIKEIDRPSEYWGMDLDELFPEAMFEKQRNELARVLNIMSDAQESVKRIMNEINEIRVQHNR